LSNFRHFSRRNLKYDDTQVDNLLLHGIAWMIRVDQVCLEIIIFKV